jgi:SnoaL-like polyketide cyclase
MDRRSLMTAAALAGTTFALPVVAQDIGGPRSLVERFAATLTAHDIVAFAALFADDYVNHQVSAAVPPPAAGKAPKQTTVDFFAARLAGIPDLQVAPEVVVVSPDHVAASFVYTGTHGGPLLGIAPRPAASFHLMRYICSPERTHRRALGNGRHRRGARANSVLI